MKTYSWLNFYSAYLLSFFQSNESNVTKKSVHVTRQNLCTTSSQKKNVIFRCASKLYEQSQRITCRENNKQGKLCRRSDERYNKKKYISVFPWFWQGEKSHFNTLFFYKYLI